MSTPQLPLGLRWTRDQQLDRYRDAPAGLLPTLRAVAEAGDRGVFLGGPPGSGRTHLLLATCAAASAAGRAVVYLPLRNFAAHVQQVLEGQRAVPLACVDDVQVIAGDRATEIALFNLHNRVRDGGGAVLYAADAMPARLPLALPDLQSRLAQCAQFPLNAPDDAQRRAILRERASVRGLDLDDMVLDYLFRHCPRDLTKLSALLDHLDRAALAAQRRVTVPFLKGVLDAD